MQVDRLGGGGGLVLNELEALSCFCSSVAKVLNIYKVENVPLIQNKGSVYECLPRSTMMSFM